MVKKIYKKKLKLTQIVIVSPKQIRIQQFLFLLYLVYILILFTTVNLSEKSHSLTL